MIRKVTGWPPAYNPKKGLGQNALNPMKPFDARTYPNPADKRPWAKEQRKKIGRENAAKRPRKPKKPVSPEDRVWRDLGVGGQEQKVIDDVWKSIGK